MSSSWANAAGSTTANHSNIWSADSGFSVRQLLQQPLPQQPQQLSQQPLTQAPQQLSRQPLTRSPQKASTNAMRSVCHAEDAKTHAAASQCFSQKASAVDSMPIASGAAATAAAAGLSRECAWLASLDLASLNGKAAGERDQDSAKARASSEFCRTLQTQGSSIDEVQTPTTEVRGLKTEKRRLKGEGQLKEGSQSDGSYAKALKEKDIQIRSHLVEIARLSSELEKIRKVNQSLQSRLDDFQQEKLQASFAAESSSAAAESSAQHDKGPSNNSKIRQLNGQIIELRLENKRVKGENQRLKGENQRLKERLAAIKQGKAAT